MKKIKVLILLLLFLTSGFFVWWQNGTAAVDKNNKTEITFVVGKGQGVREIANSLKKENLIKDPIAFFLLVRFKLNLDNKIQAGDHRVSRSMDGEQIVKALTLASNDVWVTVTEGVRAQEIADILQREIPSYQNSWRAELQKNEGYLFPDTYLIPKEASIDLVLSVFKSNFENKYSTLNINNKDKQKIVTIASLIEREARHSEDRPLVASVIYNRLEIGMKLDIDATIQYALGFQSNEKDWWKKDLTFEDLNISSPYNTYRNPGLPPSPISNPGLSSIQAALNPESTNYLFYITDNSGVNHYAKTIEEHNANIKKYGL